MGGRPSHYVLLPMFPDHATNADRINSIIGTRLAQSCDGRSISICLSRCGANSRETKRLVFALGPIPHNPRVIISLQWRKLSGCSLCPPLNHKRSATSRFASEWTEWTPIQPGVDKPSRPGVTPPCGVREGMLPLHCKNRTAYLGAERAARWVLIFPCSRAAPKTLRECNPRSFRGNIERSIILVWSCRTHGPVNHPHLSVYVVSVPTRRLVD